MPVANTQKKSLKEGWDHGTMGPLFTSALGEVRGGRQRTDGGGAHAGHAVTLSPYSSHPLSTPRWPHASVCCLPTLTSPKTEVKKGPMVPWSHPSFKDFFSFLARMYMLISGHNHSCRNAFFTALKTPSTCRLVTHTTRPQTHCAARHSHMAHAHSSESSTHNTSPEASATSNLTSSPSKGSMLTTRPM